jgi:competence protein ComEC
VKFFQVPFTVITPALLVGLMLGDVLHFSLWPLWILSCAGLLMTSFVLSTKSLFLPFAVLSVLFFGGTIMQNARFTEGQLLGGQRFRLGTVIDADHNSKTWKKVLLHVEKEQSKKQWHRANERVLMYSQEQLYPGDVVLFHATLNPIKNAGNPGEFDAENYWYSKNIRWMGFLGTEDYSLVDRRETTGLQRIFSASRSYLKETLETHVPSTEVGLAKALLLGDKSQLSHETRESFGNAGAMHVLAISGLHVGIIMYVLFFVLKGMSKWISRRSAVLITLILLWLFAGVTGGSPSVVRATLMFSLLLIGQQWGRAAHPMNILFFSAFVLLLWNPLLLFDIGFQLSYGAMLGIFIFFERIQSLVRTRNWLLNKAWDGTALGISAQLFTIPLVLYHFHQFPNYFWLTNLGIMCLAGVILALGLAFFAVHWIPFLNNLVAFLLIWALYTLLSFVMWVDTLPWTVAKGFNPSLPEIVAFITFMLVLALALHQKWIRNIAIVLLLLVVAGWQTERYEAKERAEWVVFNSNTPLISFKNGNFIEAFYLGKRSKAEHLLESYTRVNPAKWKLHELKTNRTTVTCNDVEWLLERKEHGIVLSSADSRYFLRTRYGSTNELANEVTIDMPYLESDKGNYNLSSGAFRMKL